MKILLFILATLPMTIAPAQAQQTQANPSAPEAHVTSMGIYKGSDVELLLNGQHPDVYPELKAENYTIAGKGIAHDKWGAIALVCVGKPLENGSLGCEKLRHVFFSMIGKSVFFGATISVSLENGEPSPAAIQAGIKKLSTEYADIAIVAPPFYQLQMNSNVSQITNKNGWNWSQNAKHVSERKFWRYFFMINFFLERSEQTPQAAKN